MSELLGLENFSLTAGGPTLTMSVGTGQSLGVYGPSGAGKSRLLRVFAGYERPDLGYVSAKSTVVLAESKLFSRRMKPMALARRPGPNQASLATEVLLATRLWDSRNTPVSELTPSQLAAAELLPILVEDSSVLCIDGQLDRLDPWTLASIRDYLTSRRANGVAIIVATNRPDLAKMFDAVIVLRDQRVRFAGSVDDLLRAGPAHQVQVSTKNQPGVRALVDPFQVSVQETEEGWFFVAPEGQELAARLLLEGYGDVKFVILKSPTVEEALLSLIS